MRHTWLALCCAAALFTFTACSDDSGDGSTDDGTNTDVEGSVSSNGTMGGDSNGTMGGDDAVTYHRDLRPLLETHCMSCHNGTFAPASLTFSDPEIIELLGPAIVAAVENRTMPPWHANDGCNDYKDDLALTDAEIATFKRWVDEGMERGDPNDFIMPTPREAEMNVEQLSEAPTLRVTAPEPYTPTSMDSDDFRCFVYEPGFETDRFMKGFEVIPDNTSVLHHLLVYAVPEDEADRLAELEAEDPEPGYSCFGSTRTDTDSLLVVWAPGGAKTPFPEGTGLRVKKGSKLVMQMHYNLTEGGMGMDQSGADVWFYPEGEAPEKESEMLFVGNLPFAIPGRMDGTTSSSCDTIYSHDSVSFPPASGVNVDDVTIDNYDEVGRSGCVQQDFYYALGEDLQVDAVAPHMHLYGTHISIEILPVEVGEDGHSSAMMDQADDACLFDTNRWDFDWQRLYWFKQPFNVPRRGVVRLTCRFDNSNEDEPVSIGEGSRDEMCLGLLYLTPRD